MGDSQQARDADRRERETERTQKRDRKIEDTDTDRTKRQEIIGER